MSPYAILGLALLSVIATVILAMVFTPRRCEREIKPATAGDGYHYRPRSNVSFELCLT